MIVLHNIVLFILLILQDNLKRAVFYSLWILKAWFIGSKEHEKLMKDNNMTLKIYENKFRDMQNLGITTILVSIDDEIRGIIGISDKLKDQAPYAIKKLKDMNLNIYLLTGDNKKTAEINSLLIFILYNNTITFFKN